MEATKATKRRKSVSGRMFLDRRRVVYVATGTEKKIVVDGVAHTVRATKITGASILKLSEKQRPPDQDAIISAARDRNRAIALEQAVAMKALFDQWEAEDATNDPEELKRRDQETLELQLALNTNRKATGERIPFPELDKQGADA